MTHEEIEYNARNCARMMYDTTLEREAYEKGYIKGVNDVQTRWISVEERLPEKDGCYLTLFKRNNYMCVLQFEHRLWKTIGYQSDITHWMPIPELLKGDDK